MTEQTSPSIPAGWYPDPAGGPRSRWWDGIGWTDHFQEAYSTTAVALKAPEATPAYNVWIWLVVFLPYLTLPFLFTLDFSSMFSELDPNDPTSSTRAQFALITSPGYLVMVIGGWVLTAATIFCSYRDWQWLKNAGVPKPFHWAFSFILLAGYPVYAIGRAVVTKRRTGHGSAVLWATIGMIVLSVIIALVWAGVLMSTMMQQYGAVYGTY